MFVLSEVLCQFVDACGEDSYLDFRGSCVGWVGSILLYYDCSLGLVQSTLYLRSIFDCKVQGGSGAGASRCAYLLLPNRIPRCPGYSGVDVGRRLVPSRLSGCRGLSASSSVRRVELARGRIWSFQAGVRGLAGGHREWVSGCGRGVRSSSRSLKVRCCIP